MSEKERVSKQLSSSISKEKISYSNIHRERKSNNKELKKFIRRKKSKSQIKSEFKELKMVESDEDFMKKNCPIIITPSKNISEIPEKKLSCAKRIIYSTKDSVTNQQGINIGTKKSMKDLNKADKKSKGFFSNFHENKNIENRILKNSMNKNYQIHISTDIRKNRISNSIKSFQNDSKNNILKYYLPRNLKRFEINAKELNKNKGKSNNLTELSKREKKLYSNEKKVKKDFTKKFMKKDIKEIVFNINQNYSSKIVKDSQTSKNKNDQNKKNIILENFFSNRSLINSQKNISRPLNENITKSKTRLNNNEVMNNNCFPENNLLNKNQKINKSYSSKNIDQIDLLIKKSLLLIKSSSEKKINRLRAISYKCNRECNYIDHYSLNNKLNSRSPDTFLEKIKDAKSNQQNNSSENENKIISNLKSSISQNEKPARISSQLNLEHRIFQLNQQLKLISLYFNEAQNKKINQKSETIEIEENIKGGNQTHDTKAGLDKKGKHPSMLKCQSFKRNFGNLSFLK